MKYVVLRHKNIDSPHFDFMYETAPGSMLQTWRLAQWPIHELQEATRIRDHRRAYLEYQGDLGDGRGAVVRVEEGNCLVETAERRVTVTLDSPPGGPIIFEQETGQRDDPSRWHVRVQ